MDRMLFLAMNGAKEIMSAQAINSNNLANATTTGFKADFHATLSEQVYGPGHASRVYASTTDAGVDFSQGPVVSTGRELDIAINGDGWLAVQAADGTEAYTRAGDLKVDSIGRLTNGAGHIVVGNGGPISIPAHAKLEIGDDGTISIQPIGQPVNTLAVIDRIKFINPPNEDLQKGTDGLMHLQAGREAVEDGSVRVVSGSLEASNVSTVESLVTMISLARQYETQVKLMQNAEDNDRAAAQILSVT